MNKILFLAILSLFLTSGCATYKRCASKFKIESDTVRIVSVRDSIVLRDTLIYIHLPGQTVIDSVEIPCPPPPKSYVPKKVRAEVPLAFAEAWWEYPNIKLTLVQKDTTIVHRLHNAIVEKYYWKSEYELVKQSIEKKYVPKIYKQALSICIVLFVSVIIGFVLWIRKKVF